MSCDLPEAQSPVGQGLPSACPALESFYFIILISKTMVRTISNFRDCIMTFRTWRENLFYYHLANRIVLNLRTFFN